MDDVHLDDLWRPDDEESAESSTHSAEDDAPIVRFVNKMLLDAIRLGASDITLSLKVLQSSFSYRRYFAGDVQPPTNLAPRLAARLKVMSRMDISERRVPQDAKT